MRTTMPPTIGPNACEPATRKVREIMLRYPEIITVVTHHGRSEPEVSITV